MGSSYTLDEIRSHNSEDSCWLIVNGKVYDVTDFLQKHPAEKKSILSKAGGDATRDYYFHSKRARKTWNEHYIGYVKEDHNFFQKLLRLLSFS